MQLSLAVDEGEQAFEFALLRIEAAMLRRAYLHTITVEHDLAHRRVFHDPPLLWEEPRFVGVGEARIRRLHHDIDFAAVCVKRGNQLMFFTLERRACARLCKTVYPARVNYGFRSDRERE